MRVQRSFVHPFAIVVGSRHDGGVFCVLDGEPYCDADLRVCDCMDGGFC